MRMEPDCFCYQTWALGIFTCWSLEHENSTLRMAGVSVWICVSEDLAISAGRYIFQWRVCMTRFGVTFWKFCVSAVRVQKVWLPPMQRSLFRMSHRARYHGLIYRERYGSQIDEGKMHS